MNTSSRRTDAKKRKSNRSDWKRFKSSERRKSVASNRDCRRKQKSRRKPKRECSVMSESGKRRKDRDRKLTWRGSRGNASRLRSTSRRTKSRLKRRGGSC